MKNPRQKPVYTKARHEVYEPKYIAKKIQVHKKFVFEQHETRETFYSAYASAVKFIPGSETNSHLPSGYLNLQCGNYNKFQMHTRDFIALAASLTEFAQWLNDNAPKLQEVLNQQIEAYNNHEFKKWLLTNEIDTDQPTPPQQ